jgi:hypothetical protein
MHTTTKTQKNSNNSPTQPVDNKWDGDLKKNPEGTLSVPQSVW